MKLNLNDVRVTVMGLGLHGGGLAVARYLTARGARVTVTDLRSEETLRPSLEQLPPDVRSVIGRHEPDDFRNADLVVKNPAVPRGVPMLREATAITTDIALFLAEWMQAAPEGRPSHGEAGQPAAPTPPGPLVAVTGTKGKSTTSACAAHILREQWPTTRLGGNITVSPLTFVDDLSPGDPVVLELSSFQLGDLAYCRTVNRFQGASSGTSLSRGGSSDRHGPTERLLAGLPRGVFHPVVPASVAIITNIFRDHQDYYATMEAYVEDKREIYRHLADGGVAVFTGGDRWGDSFLKEARELYGTERVIDAGAFGVGHGDDAQRRNAAGAALLPRKLTVPGEHGRANATLAAIAARHLGVDGERIARGAARFPGVPHRLEVVARHEGVMVVNDSAATIPEASLAAVRAFDVPVVLITGGTDKGLDYAPLVTACGAVHAGGGSAVLLAGTATQHLTGMLDRSAIPYAGPFDDLASAVAHAWDVARRRAAPLNEPAGSAPHVATDADTAEASNASDTAVHAVLLLSPGCASFGMFLNEFDRGDQFRRLIQAET